MDLLNWMFDNHPHIMTAAGLTIGGGLSLAIIETYDALQAWDREKWLANMAEWWHGWQVDVKEAFTLRAGNYD